MLLYLLTLFAAGQTPEPTSAPTPPNPVVVQRPQKILPDPVPRPTDEPFVTLPQEIRARAGSWIVVAPVSLNGGPPKFDVPAGMTEVDISAIFGPDAIKNAKGKVLQSDTNGTYVVSAWNAKGDVASKISKCSVIITGGNGPVVVPPPGPPVTPPGPPNPPPPPTPVDLGPDTLGFAKFAMAEAGKITDASERAKAVALADNFEAVSAKLAATATMTVNAAETELATKNRGTLSTPADVAAWTPFFAAWKAFADADASVLTTKPSYVTAYADTAKGLRAAAAAK
jgi:hypothetical protein